MDGAGPGAWTLRPPRRTLGADTSSKLRRGLACKVGTAQNFRNPHPLICYFELRPNKTVTLDRQVESPHKDSLQLRVLRPGFLQDGDVEVGVFPEREEILIHGLRFGLLQEYNIGIGVAAQYTKIFAIR
jgi:hypothetical protein